MFQSFIELKKEALRQQAPKHSIDLAILSDVSTQHFVYAIKWAGIVNGIDFNVYEADYDQISQNVFNKESQFHQKESEFVIILISSEKLLESFQKLDVKERASFSSSKISYFENIVANIPNTCKVIFNSFPHITDSVFGNFSSSVEESFNYQLSLLNLKLKKLLHNSGNLFLCDIEALQNQVGLRNRIHYKFYFSYKMAYRLDFLPLLSKNYVDIIKASRGIQLKKCLILDLDNTTWGGVIGDDGIEGIQIGNLGIGKAFDSLQLWAKDLKNRGVIICICSKNTQSIAKEPFEKHPDMILSLNDISVFVANWENKADNIRHIQQVLNIGFDSMVFLDDNPFERNLVRKELPEITVPELPKDPAEYMDYIHLQNLFETVSYSTEDNNRTKRYQDEAKRLASKQSFSSIDDYLDSLSMTAEIKAVDNFSIPRVSQLTQRSNQFNLRTKRYSEEEINNMISNDEFLAFQVSLSDKYGEYGIISLVIGEKKSNTLFIDTWIMSCRVLKRGVEKLVVNFLAEKARELNIDTIVGEYIPTLKNGIVAGLYFELGFIESSTQKFEMNVPNFEDFPHKIKLVS